jgi:hypothetical protein
MLRILRAFAWLRWRILVNSLERTSGRDIVERFSVAIEQLGPAIALLVMVPSAAALAAAAAYSGWALAQDDAGGVVFSFLRIILFAGCVLATIAPLILPSAERTNAVRLLLLPIPRGVLFLGQMMSALADPWIVLIAVIILFLPLGMIAGGSLAGALAAFAAGLLLIGALLGITLVVTTAVHLIVRDRRRGELVALLFILILPILGVMPGLIESSHSRGSRGEIAQPPEQVNERGDKPQGRTDLRYAVERAASVIPSEMYTKTLRAIGASSFVSGIVPLAGLAAMAALLHGAAFAVFVRVLNAPATMGSSRTAGHSRGVSWRLPAVTPATSAVAVNQVRLALRTPRGRAMIFSPIVVFVMCAVLMMRGGSEGLELGAIRLQSGIGLAAFASFVSLLAILPIAMNQFAIDRAGLTMALLAPLKTHEILAGKAIANALVAAIPASVCFAGALIRFPSGNPALWLSIPLTLAASYLLFAPIAAILSAIFPRAVDLNSIGRGSNPHGAAGLLGWLVFLLAGAPCLLLVLLATKILERPVLAPVFLLIWIFFCAGLSLALFVAAAKVFARRRENLGMIV